MPCPRHLTETEPLKPTTPSGSFVFFIFLPLRSSWSFGHPLALILVHFGRRWAPIDPSWVLPGVPQGALGVPLGSPWAHLGPSWAHLDPSWTHPGLLLAPLGSILLLYGPYTSNLGPRVPFCTLLFSFWDPFGQFWDCLGVILGSFWLVLCGHHVVVIF